MGENTTLRDSLDKYRPAIPMQRLIEELNSLYHRVEAAYYDQRHPEVYKQLPRYWAEMVAVAAEERPRQTWRVLNFGCGTGFEAMQVIQAMGVEKISSISCYDPVKEMVDLCAVNIGRLIKQSRFFTSLEELKNDRMKYDLLVTNSVLHHLYEPFDVIQSLLSELSSDALWLSGHEPSRRFYLNNECDRLYKSFRREYRWRKFLMFEPYLKRIKRVCHIDTNPSARTARMAFEKGLFSKKPPAELVQRIVDFHVPGSAEEALSGNGLDVEEMDQILAGVWQRIWTETYGFLGPYYEVKAPRKWRALCAATAKKFPLDGSNFCTVWKRVG